MKVGVDPQKYGQHISMMDMIKKCECGQPVMEMKAIHDQN
ncbi:hypothetical protein [Dehalobacterium formicoaceticum]